MILRRFAYLGLLLLIGCSSHRAQDEQLELLASSRAQFLSSQLPIKSGPLSIMRASAHKNVVELMMIYNSDAKDVPSTNQLMASSVKGYCADKNTRNNLEAGLAYRIKIRNNRGQLMIDKVISKQDCSATTSTKTK
jgi:hypothetical protein